MPATTYAFDPTGTNPANRVVNEQHVITATNFREFNYVIPDFAPFFETNIVLSFRDSVGNVRTLTKGIDYYFTHQFISASRACATPIYGSICFLDSETAGVLQISYNSVGGVWTLSEAEIVEILADSVYNPRITAWEQVTDLPITFPVIDHEWDLVDMVGASDIVDKLDGIRDAILAGSGGGLSAHVANRTNPHDVTKAQVGLANVSDFPVASVQQAQDGIVNTAYMTPALVKAAIDNSSTSGVAAHANRTDNPHATTKSQVGLGNVDNFATASNTVAIAGTSTNTFMTPASTKAATDIVTAALNTHTANVLNPHNTTKDQIGLFNVENYEIATVSDAQVGTATDKYMTPVRTKQAITALALTPLNDHVIDQSNPHGTTKGQVGLGSVQNFPVATMEEAQGAVSNATYMTPLRVAQTIAQLSSQIVSSHANLTNNPHSTTAAQVGAYSIAQSDSLLLNKLGSTAKAADTLLLDGRTFAVAKTEILAGTATNASQLQGLTIDDIFEERDMYYSEPSHVVNPANTASTYVWFKVATVTPTDLIPGYVFEPDEAPSTKRDGHWLVTGGESLSADLGALHYVHMGIRRHPSGASSAFLEVRNITGQTTGNVTFGYVYSGGIGNLYARCPNGTVGMSATNLQAVSTSHVFSYLESVEPVGIQYVTAQPASYDAERLGGTLAADWNARITAIENRLTAASIP